LEAFEKAIKIYPNYGMALVAKGQIAFKLNKFEEALNAFEQAIALNDKSLLPVSLFEKGKCLLALNQLDEGYICLDNALSGMDTLGKKQVLDPTNITILMFSGIQDANTQESNIQKLIKLFSKHNALDLLEEGLVTSGKYLVSFMIYLKAVQANRDLWKAVVGERDELAIAFRFMNVAIKYYENDKDPRVLLELPIEEREILQEVLKSNT
ncbi:MAG: tetratricopeptide repeat protein, partial [Blastocatellia bacterium]|nr:tetratricopeptide repeat protein [Blastocatellia bacterium]